MIVEEFDEVTHPPRDVHGDLLVAEDVQVALCELQGWCQDWADRNR